MICQSLHRYVAAVRFEAARDGNKLASQHEVATWVQFQLQLVQHCGQESRAVGNHVHTNRIELSTLKRNVFGIETCKTDTATVRKTEESSKHRRQPIHVCHHTQKSSSKQICTVRLALNDPCIAAMG